MSAGVEEIFRALPPEEREAIINYGAAWRLTSLAKRLFLAESKVRHYEEKHKTTLAEWELHGLPDDADYESHEDYVLWHHWTSAANKARQEMTVLEGLVAEGVQIQDHLDAGG